MNQKAKKKQNLNPKYQMIKKAPMVTLRPRLNQKVIPSPMKTSIRLEKKK